MEFGEVSKKLTTEEYISKVYSKYPGINVLGEYITSKHSILLSCKVCGTEWEAIAGRVLESSPRGHKCPKCTKHARAISQEDFISRLPQNIEVIDTYLNNHTKVTIKYKDCGHTTTVNPQSIMYKGTKKLCKICYPSIPWNKKSKAEVLEELVDLEGSEIIEIVGNYTGSNEVTKVRCKEGHEWDIYPNVSVNKSIGIKCPRCAEHTRASKVAEIAKSYGISTDIVFSKTNKPIRFTCSEGHTWSNLLGNFLYYGSGSKCPICTNRGRSTKELELLDFIKSRYTGWIVENDRKLIGKEIDILLPDLGIGIEFNGTYYHSSKFKDSNYHIEKTNLLENEGFNLLHISEYLWDMKKELIKSKLNSIFGFNIKIPARKCTVKPISYPKEFLNTNHIQGAGSPTKYNYGLYYQDELVMVATFSAPRFNKSAEYELVRLAALMDINVVGGASKLIKHFLKEHNNPSIISYCRRDFSSGNVYKTLGFKYLYTTAPGYEYFNARHRLSRYQCQKHMLKDKYPDLYQDSLTEEEIMKLAGFYKVYDSGNLVFKYN